MKLSFQINNNPIQINPQEIPVLSPSTLYISEDMGFKPPSTLPSLKNRMQMLEKTLEGVEHPKAYKAYLAKKVLLGVLALALAAALVAGIVLGAIALLPITSIGAAAVIIVCALAYIILTQVYVGEPLHGNYGLFLGILIIGPFAPLWRALKECAISLDPESESKKLQKELSDVVAFFSTETTPLLDRIQEELDKTKKAVSALNALATNSFHERQDNMTQRMTYKMTLLQTSKQELDAAQRFFHTSILNIRN